MGLGLTSKADIGTGGLCTNNLKILCGLSLHNANADCGQKGFCWCIITREFTRSSKITCIPSLHLLSQCRVRTNTFVLVWYHHCWNSQVIGLRYQREWPCQPVWNGFSLSCLEFNWGTWKLWKQLPIGGLHRPGTSRSNNRELVSKAQSGMGSECPKSMKIACSRSLSTLDHSQMRLRTWCSIGCKIDCKLYQCHLCIADIFAGVMWKER